MVVHPDGTTKTESLRRAPRLQDMQALVGGPIEPIPHMDYRAVDEGNKTHVAAYGNEEGRRLGLPPNEMATRMWRKSAVTDEILVGTVLFFWGDVTFMRSL